MTANEDRNTSEARSREVGETNMGLLKAMIDTLDRKIEDEISGLNEIIKETCR